MKKPLRLTASLVAAGALVVGVAGAAVAATISGTSPLTQIAITEDLNCDVSYLGDAQPEFFGGTACATLAAVGGTLYGPESIPAGSSAEPRTRWTPTSQSQSGSGTASDPFKITSVVQGGPLSLTQVDTYVNGDNSYRTTISVTNTSGAAVNSVVYHAADCYLQNSDYGFGEYNPATGAITCRAPDEQGEHSAAGRIEEFVPLTGGSNYLYDTFGGIWSAVGSQDPFPDEVRNGDTLIDNGIGLSWTLAIPAGASQSVSFLTNFSPLGEVGLPTSLSAAPSSVAVGASSTVSASVNNPNVTAQSLTSLTMTLPSQVNYVADSASGIGEPTVSADGRSLTFAGPIAVDAEGTLNFTIQVAGATIGIGTLELFGSSAGGAPVLSSSGSITVTDGEPGPVTLGTPEVIQATCAAPGEPTAPVVNLPEDSSDVTYSLEGDVVAGQTVQVKAQANPGSLLPATAEGWTVNENRDVATMQIQLDTVDCPLLSAIPEKPLITQATCDAAPKVALANTAGIDYSGVPETVKAGGTFTLVATAQTGYVLGEATGWTMQEDGTAILEVKLDPVPSDCAATPTKKGALPATGVSAWAPWLAGGSALAVAAGIGLLALHRQRRF